MDGWGRLEERSAVIFRHGGVLRDHIVVSENEAVLPAPCYGGSAITVHEAT